MASTSFKAFKSAKPSINFLFQVSPVLQLARRVHTRPGSTGVLSETCLQLQSESSDL